MHYCYIYYCNIFSLLLRLLAISNKMFRFIIIITFISFYLLNIKLNELFIIIFMLY